MEELWLTTWDLVNKTCPEMFLGGSDCIQTNSSDIYMENTPRSSYKVHVNFSTEVRGTPGFWRITWENFILQAFGYMGFSQLDVFFWSFPGPSLVKDSLQKS